MRPYCGHQLYTVFVSDCKYNMGLSTIYIYAHITSNIGIFTLHLEILPLFNLLNMWQFGLFIHALVTIDPIYRRLLIDSSTKYFGQNLTQPFVNQTDALSTKRMTIWCWRLEVDKAVKALSS